jgi:putative restriction endonuclease
MFAISPTDNNWFKFLKDNDFNSFINFWTPTPWNIKKLKPGDKWYFLLKSPIREIGGFGEFFEYKNLTAFEAWRLYGHKNGATDLQQFINSIQLYIDKNSNKFGGTKIDINTYEIGCIILNNCQFWDFEDYKKAEDHEIVFGKQVVKYKYFNQYDPFKINEQESNNDFNILREPRENYKREINQRKGQSKFKGHVLKSYKNRCCITGETCPELLEAAHLQKYINNQSNHIQNGILLRVDIHRLFDNDLLFIDQNYVIHISSLIENPIYKQYHGCKMSLPNDLDDFPSKKSLELRRLDFRQ